MTRNRFLVCLVAACLVGALAPAAGSAEPAAGPYEALLTGIQSDDSIDSAKASQAFIQGVSPTDTPIVVGLLTHSNAVVRQVAIEALYRIGDASVVDPVAACLDDPNSFIRRRACEVLGKINDRRALPALMRAVQNPDQAVRRCAFSALEKTAAAPDMKILLPVLEAEQPPAPTGAAEEDAAARRDALMLKADIIGLAGKLKASDALPAIKPFLADPEPYLRAVAAQAVARIGGMAEFDTLKPLFQDPHEYVKFSAMAAVAEIGTPEALAAIKTFLKDLHAAVPGTGIGMKTVLVTLLGTLKDPSSVDVVAAAYRFDDGYGGRLTKDLRLACAESLAAIGGVQAVKGLTETLGDKQASVRLASAKGLAKAADPSTGPALDAALAREGDTEVVTALKAAMAALPKTKAKGASKAK